MGCLKLTYRSGSSRLKVVKGKSNISIKSCAGVYGYGFNGKEKDDEIKGEGNSIAYEARIYDSRLGRFLSIDPWTDKYPWQTPYAYHRNNPVAFVDWNGYGDPDGKKRAEKAKKVDNSDTRSYKQSRAEGYKTDNFVDCSEFAAEIQVATGYTNGGTKASVQAKKFQETGEYSTSLKDVKLGDQLFFKMSGGINHTGIVTEIDSDGNIYVTHATVNKKRPGSIKTNKLNSDGSIPYWNNTFVGTGRPKLKVSTSASTKAAVKKTATVVTPRVEITYGPYNLSTVEVVASAPDNSFGGLIQTRPVMVLPTPPLTMLPIKL
jgi:RHS repeat-associated protein